MFSSSNVSVKRIEFKYSITDQENSFKLYCVHCTGSMVLYKQAALR